MFYRFKHKKLHIDVAFAKNQNGKNILKLSGLPAFPKEDNFTKYCQESGFNVFIPHYFGSWLSDGIFTPDNCIKSVSTALDFINQKGANELYNYENKNWLNDEVIISGSSFGGYIALKYCSSSVIKKCALFSPLVDLESQGLIEGEEIMKHTLRFVREVFKNGFRGVKRSEWDDFFSGKLNELKIDTSSLVGKSFFICHGLSDPTINIKHSREFNKKIEGSKLEYHEIKDADHKIWDYLTEEILIKFKSFVLE